MDSVCPSEVFTVCSLASHLTSFPIVANILKRRQPCVSGRSYSSSRALSSSYLKTTISALWCQSTGLRFCSLWLSSKIQHMWTRLKISAFRAPEVSKLLSTPQDIQNLYWFLFSSVEFLYMGQHQSLARQNWQTIPRKKIADNRLLTSEELCPLQIFSLFKLLCLHSFPMSLKYIFPNLSAFYFVIVAEMISCYDLLYPS